MKNAPDYVSGVKGRFEIAVPIKHPPYCVCKLCPHHRSTPEEWAAPFLIKARRKSKHPDNRPRTSAAAFALKEAMEAQLVADVKRAADEKRAQGNAVPFVRVCDAYRERLQTDGKRYDRDRYRIDALERFFGHERDVATLDRDAYEALTAKLTADEASPATIARYTSTLVAMMNSAVKDRIITGHNLTQLRRPQIKKTKKPVVFTTKQAATLLGPAMREYEKEQASELQAWQRLLHERAEAGHRPTVTKGPSVVPLRGFCLIAYLSLMRPSNNFHLRWSQIKLERDEDTGRFRLDEHKNASKGVEVEAALHPILCRYLRQIAPGAGSAAYVHANPATGKPYLNIRKQWARLCTIANGMLPVDEQLTGARLHFYAWRHTGASALAEAGADPVMIVRMMGDTSLKTVMDHYFDSSVEHMAGVMKKWEPAIGVAIEAKEGESEWAN
jgi:integrase